jgi:hypothetical protein
VVDYPISTRSPLAASGFDLELKNELHLYLKGVRHATDWRVFWRAFAGYQAEVRQAGLSISSNPRRSRPTQSLPFLLLV